MSTLQKLQNIGRVTEKLLSAVEINTPEKLIEMGSKEAFLGIRVLDPTACLNMLYGLEGAVQGIKDTELSIETRQDLKTFYKQHPNTAIGGIL